MRISIIAKPDSTCAQRSGCQDVAAGLLASVPASAKAIALALHERAAWGCDQALEAHWAEVLRLIGLAKLRPGEAKPVAAAVAKPARRKSPWAISSGASALSLALMALASLAPVALPCASRAAQLDPEDAMVQEFQSFCVDYYTPAQCAGAVRFILKTSGSEYFVNLHNDESPDGFLDRLAVAIKGGEALRQKEATLAVKTGE
jgi:hypothetical protein